MCLIVFKRNEDEYLTLPDFRSAVSKNPDGTGIMYPQDGRVVVKKAGVLTYLENGELYEEWSKQPRAALHVRIATHGDKNSDDNAHPFQVLDKDKDGVDLWLMHNGTVPRAKIIDTKMSDTWHFVNLYLRPLLYHNSYCLMNPFIQDMIKAYVGYSRMLFMYGDGATVIISDGGDSEDPKHGGCWLSNTNSLYTAPAYSAPYRAPGTGWFEREDWKGKEWDNTKQDWVEKKGVYVPVDAAEDDLTTPPFIPHSQRNLKEEEGDSDDKSLNNFSDNGSSGGLEEAEQEADTTSSEDNEQKGKKEKGGRTSMVKYAKQTAKVLALPKPGLVLNPTLFQQVVVRQQARFERATTLEELMECIAEMTDEQLEYLVRKNPATSADALKKLKDLYQYGNWDGMA